MQEMILTDNLCHEKKKEDDLPAVKIAWIDQYEKLRTTLKWTQRQKTVLSTHEKTEKKTSGKEIGRKTTVWTFPATKKGKIPLHNTWAWLGKGNLKREIESFLTAVQKNTVSTNYIDME